MKKFDTIDNIVVDILSSIGVDAEGRGYIQMARLVLRTLDDLSYNVKPNIASKVFTVESNGTISYPEDSYKVISAGICLPNGAVAILGKIDHSPIALEKKATCNCDGCSGSTTVSASANVCPSCIFFNHIEGNNYIGELYGFVEEGFPYGRWFDNELESRIEFTSVVKPGASVVLKYQTAADRFTYKLVPVEDYELVRTKTLWKYFQSSNTNKAEYFRSMYRVENARYNKRKDDPNYIDLIDALASNYSNAAR